MNRAALTDDNMFFVWKVIDGALQGDREKVLAYSEHLLAKLEAAGDVANARRLSQILGKAGHNTMAALQRAPGDIRPSKLPVDSESRLPVADEEFWPDGSIPIVLSPEIRNQVDRFIRHFKGAERLLATGVPISPSMLLHGPPGTGKTQVARFIASALGLPLVVSRSDALISSYLGSTAKNVRTLFEHAASRPCVLFLDEFDAIAKMRDDGQEVGELKRVVIGLLQNIDAIGRDHLLVAATNHPHLLDKAIWRRFAHHIQLGLPEEEERACLLRIFLRGEASDQAVGILAAASGGLSGAQLRDISEDALRESVLGSAPLSIPSLIDAVIAAKGGQPSQLSVAAKVKFLNASGSKRFTQKAVADIFGLSQSRISRLANKAE